MISIVDLFRKEKALLHTDAEVRNPLHLLSMLRVYYELRKPEGIYKFLSVFHNVIKDQVQEYK